jgi:hypothetical protein
MLERGPIKAAAAKAATITRPEPTAIARTFMGEFLSRGGDIAAIISGSIRAKQRLGPATKPAAGLPADEWAITKLRASWIDAVLL